MDKSRLLELIRSGTPDPFLHAVYQGGGKGSPPPSPDYAAAARAQGAANVDTARVEGQMSNPNIFSPYGSRTVTWDNTLPEADQQRIQESIDARKAQIDQLHQQQFGVSIYDPSVPQSTRDAEFGGLENEYRRQFGFAPMDQPTVNIEFSPEQQARFEQEQAFYNQLMNYATGQFGRVEEATGQPFDLSGIPGMIGSLQGYDFQSQLGPYGSPSFGYGSGGDIRYGTNFNQPVQSQIGYQGPGQQFGFGQAGTIQNRIGYGGPSQQFGFGGAGNIQNALNFSGAPQLPGINDFSADRQRIEEAIYSRMNDNLNRERDTLRSSLIQRGLSPTSEAFQNEMDQFNRAANDLRQQAVLAGGQEQSRLFGLGMAGRQQSVGEQQAMGQFANLAQQQAYQQQFGRGAFANAAQQAAFNQALQGGQFSNLAQQQAYNQALGRGEFANQAQSNAFNQAMMGGQFANTAQQQAFNQAMTNLQAYNAAQQQANQQNLQQAGFGNQAQQQLYGQQLGAGQFFNQAQQQQLAQLMALANFQNQARQSSIQEQAYMRQLPLNEINALRMGTQTQLPQFQNFTGVNIAPPPIFGAAQAQYGADLNNYNAQVGQDNAMMGGLFGLGGAALMSPWAGGLFMSDRRLKHNIKEIGKHPLGIGIYQFNYIWNDDPQIGVMADEVLDVMPEAIINIGGYLAVDYGRL